MAIETWGCGVRHIQLVLLLISRIVELNLLWTLRVSIILAERDATSNHTLFDDPYRQTVRAWTPNQKGILNDAYLILSFIAYLVGGWMTLIVDLKWLMLVTVAINTILTYAFPHICVGTNYNVVLTTTIVMGFMFVVKEPAIMAILGQWTPTGELGRTVPFTFSTMTFSHFTLIFLYQFIKNSPAAWSSIFYLMGNLGVLWCVGWYTFGFQEPDRCFYVSLRERNFIANNIPVNTFGRKKTEIPWKRMFKSPPFYGVLISTVMFKWMLVLVMYSNILMCYVQSKTIGYDFGMYIVLFTAMFLVPFVLCLAGYISDKVIIKRKVRNQYPRNTFNSISFWGTTVVMLLLSYDAAPIIAFLYCGLYMYAANVFYLGSPLNYFDVDRAMTGFIYGLVNFFAHIPIAYVNSMYPLLRKALKEEDSNIAGQFKDIWNVGILMSFFGNFFYICLATDQTYPMVTVAPMAPRTSAIV